jgi:hypothetical protein
LVYSCLHAQSHANHYLKQTFQNESYLQNCVNHSHFPNCIDIHWFAETFSIIKPLKLFDYVH